MIAGVIVLLLLVALLLWFLLHEHRYRLVDEYEIVRTRSRDGSVSFGCERVYRCWCGRARKEYNPVRPEVTVGRGRR